MDLPLSIPQSKKNATPPVEIRVKHVEAWLASLPLANSVQTALQLHHALSALNRVEVSPSNRLELIELYRGPVAAVTAALYTHFAHLTLPLSPKTAQLADFLRQLHGEMAYAYKLILKGDAARARGGLKRDALVLVGERCIRYLSQVLLHSYQVYRPAPVNTWREIHAVYSFFERQQWQRDSVPDPLARSGRASLEHRYKQVLLLGLSGPYQLAPNECHQVYAFVDQWAGEAIIESDTDLPERTGRFLVDLNTDVPAVPFPREGRISPAPHLRVLHADRLASAVQGLVARLQRGESPKTVGLGVECVGPSCIDVLQRLMRFWGMAVRRQYSRTKREGELSVCAGLNATHFFASGQRAFCVISNRVADGESDTALSDTQPLLDLQDGEVGSLLPARFPILQEAFHVDLWRVRDEGAGGVSLFRTGRGGSVRVGDVIGIEDVLTGQWRIGVARWLRSPDSDSVEMGVEMLAPHAEPVAVTAMAKHGNERTRYAQALLLPALPIIRKPASLLVPRGTYQPGIPLTVTNETKGESYLVRPLELIERTNAFERLAFATAE